ncbi:MAG: threonine/serine dehydratase [Planctomycetaceae bacterium]|jgi:threonine dehydratase|nr:threonine/serine dehydratase [Planctomycetaceae bacterium]
MSVTIEHLHDAQRILAGHMSPAPLVRSYALERQLGLPADRRVWIKDYGWTPVGSFKLMGALYWMSKHAPNLAGRPVAAHSSGNFASGLSYAGHRFEKRVIIVMPESAPKIKFENTRRYGAEVRTYDITTDHLTGVRDRLAKEIAEQEQALQASPYDDPYVIAGNGVGGLEIVQSLKEQGRRLSHFVCAVSGGGLMAGHALAIADGFPDAKIIGVEPDQADDFRQSRIEQRRVRLPKPTSICDGLLSYDVGLNNWPILQRLVSDSVVCSDHQTKRAMAWLYQNHGLRTEPSGAITTAAVLEGKIPLGIDGDGCDGTGDIVVVLSGRNIDEEVFEKHLSDSAFNDASC